MKTFESKSVETESRLVVVRELTVNRHEGSFGGDRNVPKLNRGDSCTTWLSVLKITKLHI